MTTITMQEAKEVKAQVNTLSKSDSFLFNLILSLLDDGERKQAASHAKGKPELLALASTYTQAIGLLANEAKENTKRKADEIKQEEILNVKLAKDGMNKTLQAEIQTASDKLGLNISITFEPEKIPTLLIVNKSRISGNSGRFVFDVLGSYRFNPCYVLKANGKASVAGKAYRSAYDLYQSQFDIKEGKEMANFSCRKALEDKGIIIVYLDVDESKIGNITAGNWEGYYNNKKNKFSLTSKNYKGQAMTLDLARKLQG